MKIVLIAACAASLATMALAQTTPMPDNIKPTGIRAFAFNVVDLEKAKTFYENAIGLKTVTRVPATGEVREYLMNFTGVSTDRPVFIIYKVAGPRLPGQDNAGRVVFGTPDAAAIARRVVAAGGKANGEIRDGRTNIVFDPEGNRIELYQPAPPAAAPAAPAR